MSIHVTDFKWEKGKNDLEYIALLEKNIDAMAYKFRECAKVAREQYNKGYEKGRTDSIKDTELFREIFLDKLKQQSFDREESLMYINICTMAWNEFLDQMQKGTEE